MHVNSTVTLNDGREVDSSSPEWRDECLTRHRHMENMDCLCNNAARHDYVRRVRISEGDTAADRLTTEYRQRLADRAEGRALHPACGRGLLSTPPRQQLGPRRES